MHASPACALATPSRVAGLCLWQEAAEPGSSRGAYTKHAPAPSGSGGFELTKIAGLSPAPTKHSRLIAWVESIAALTKPDRVHWCDGSDAEWEQLTAELVAAGTLKALDPKKRPNSFYAASDPKDVARVESRTFI